VDESGTTHDQNQQYFVLAGFCVFERQGSRLARLFILGGEYFYGGNHLTRFYHANFEIALSDLFGHGQPDSLGANLSSYLTTALRFGWRCSFGRGSGYNGIGNANYLNAEKRDGYKNL
ncbi:MAG: hypothetical protein WBB18_05740, partial [Nodosilinea sp.]